MIEVIPGVVTDVLARVSIPNRQVTAVTLAPSPTVVLIFNQTRSLSIMKMWLLLYILNTK